ncbi:MAG: TetR/AcrR family transcriptional regulator [Balneolaceae bacterium]
MAKHNFEDILDTGIELLRTHGYYGTGIQHVLTACEMPKGSFYNYFESKQAFVQQSVERYIQGILTELNSLLMEESLSGRDKVEQFFRNQLRYYQEKEYRMTCLMSILSFELGGDETELTRSITAGFGAMRELISRMIKQGQDEGEITTNFTPSELTDHVMNGFNGALIAMKHERSPRAVNRFLDVELRMLSPAT